MREFQSVLLAAVVVSCGCTVVSSAELTEQELDAIRRASGAYVQAWLANDAEAVMATFVPEPVPSPPRMPVLEGQEAAQSFWWPEGSAPTTVTRFETEVAEVGGSGHVGFVRGTFVLEFEYEGASYTNLGTYLHLLEETQDAGWRISHHFWNDFPRE